MSPLPSKRSQLSVKKQKATLWDETKRLFNPHKVYVDLSQKLYDTKTELLNEAHK